MIEPTETESLATLNGFVDAMKSIAREAENSPELLRNAPLTTKTSRVDEARAARDLILRWKSGKP